MPTSLYPADFYANRRAHTAHAASRIFAALPAKLPRNRVADIGCGTGTFLVASGADYQFGIEGDWVKPDMLDAPDIVFESRDLEQRFRTEADAARPHRPRLPDGPDRDAEQDGDDQPFQIGLAEGIHFGLLEELRNRRQPDTKRDAGQSALEIRDHEKLR